ncbi:MAG: holo-ACP synthase [Gammaproteobacteria bacterium]|nr:holo-ACP synthase [Gammaproteobacteria bacterium]
MIVGIGVDIIEIARVDKLNQKFGERFARRVLTGDELLEFERRKHSSNYLATRFAAKEAVAKACGTGIGGALGFHSMQIENDAQGKPILRFLEAADALVTRLQIRNSLVSLSDEKHYVVAMVVLES